MGQISSNLLKKASATGQHAFLSPSIAFYDILLGHAQESKFGDFGRESDLHVRL